MSKFYKFIFRFFLLFTTILFFVEVSSLKAEEGVVFDEAEIKISKNSLKNLNTQLIESIYDEKTGINELRFSLKKKGAKPNINFIIQQKDGHRVLEKIDSNNDGFFEMIRKTVSSEDYSVEEFISLRNSRYYDLRRRYYPILGGQLARLQISTRKTDKEEFKVVEETITTSIQYEASLSSKRQCLENTSFYLDSNLVDSVNDIVNSYNIAWPNRDDFDLLVQLDVDRSCDRKTSNFLDSRKSMKQIYGEAINQGMVCLQDLADRSRDSSSFSNLLYLNSAASLAGQRIYETPLEMESMSGGQNGFPRRARSDNFRRQKVICSQRDRDFSVGGSSTIRGNGMASTGVDHQTHLNCEGGRLKVNHPFISLNFERLEEQAANTDNYPLRDRERYLKELIFHEFLHTTGAEHKSHYDPITACAKYCFNGSGSGRSRELSKRLCEGEGMGQFNITSLESRVDLQLQYNSYLNQSSTDSVSNMLRELAPQIGRRDASALMP